MGLYRETVSLESAMVDPKCKEMGDSYILVVTSALIYWYI